MRFSAYQMSITPKNIINHDIYNRNTPFILQIYVHSGHNKSHIRLTKFPTSTPPGVGDRFIVPVSLHCQIRIFPLLNTYIHFIANGCPHLKIRIFKSPHTHFCSPFCGHLRICGRDKSVPYGC